MGHFKVKSKVNLDSVQLGDKFEESDYAGITPTGNFVQMEYIEDVKEQRTYIVEPGLWAIHKTMTGLKLNKTSFVKDAILESFVNTKELLDKMDCFFNNLAVYKEFNIEVPKRSALLYGPAGSGKTVSAIAASNNYLKDEKTAVVIWPTDKLDAHEVKDFVKLFDYKGVERLILIMEDLGGVEIDQVRMKSTSSLLSLLDNKETTFRIPIFIIATTNHPENFLANLMNRPDRFDDKIEMGYPKPADRHSLLKFFGKTRVNEEDLELIEHKKYSEFSAAHLREVVIRSALHGISVKESMNRIHKEIQTFKDAFVTNKQKLGIVNDDYEFPE